MEKLHVFLFSLSRLQPWIHCLTLDSGSWQWIKMWKSGSNPKRGSQKRETVRWRYREPWLFAQRITRLMWINWTRHCPDSLFRQESFLLSEETEWRPEVTTFVSSVYGSPISGVCMRVWIYIYEVLLGSQGGSHLSTKLCFRGRPALTCTAGSWHTLY